MLAGHDEHAIELGRGALELGERFRLDQVRARSLDDIGVSRVNIGDVGGIEDLKLSLAIGEAANSIEAWQAASNMASMFFQLGYLEKADEMRSRARAINERFGIPGFERWSLGEDVESFYQRGRWDEAETISTQWLEDLGPSGHYLEATVRVYRSQLSFARDDVDAAVQEGELSLQRARVVRIPRSWSRFWRGGRFSP